MEELFTKVTRKNINDLADKLSISQGLAHDLLILSGNDADLVCAASDESRSIEMLKVSIIDARFKRLEK